MTHRDGFPLCAIQCDAPFIYVLLLLVIEPLTVCSRTRSIDSGAVQGSRSTLPRSRQRCGTLFAKKRCVVFVITQGGTAQSGPRTRQWWAPNPLGLRFPSHTWRERGNLDSAIPATSTVVPGIYLGPILPRRP